MEKNRLPLKTKKIVFSFKQFKHMRRPNSFFNAHAHFIVFRHFKVTFLPRIPTTDCGWVNFSSITKLFDLCDTHSTTTLAGRH